MNRQLPSQPFVKNSSWGSPLATARSQSIRPGAQLMLQSAVKLEVTEFLDRHHEGPVVDLKGRHTLSPGLYERDAYQA